MAANFIKGGNAFGGTASPTRRTLRLPTTACSLQSTPVTPGTTSSPPPTPRSTPSPVRSAAGWFPRGARQLRLDRIERRRRRHQVSVRLAPRPWRIGIDACWNGASVQAATAKAFLLNNTNFFAGKAMNGIGRVFDIYQMGGIMNSRRGSELDVGGRFCWRRRDGERGKQRDREVVPGSCVSLRSRRELHVRPGLGRPRATPTSTRPSVLITAITMSGNFNSF